LPRRPLTHQKKRGDTHNDAEYEDDISVQSNSSIR